jgi:hypothetical protein
MSSRKYRQSRRKVTVLVHGPAGFVIEGASPLVISSNIVSVSTTGTPVTGMGRAPTVFESGDANLIGGSPLYWFMKVANKSLTQSSDPAPQSGARADPSRPAVSRRVPARAGSGNHIWPFVIWPFVPEPSATTRFMNNHMPTANCVPGSP